VRDAGLLELVYVILPEPVRGPVLLAVGSLLLAWGIVAWRSGRLSYYGAVEVTLNEDGWLYWVELGLILVCGVGLAVVGVEQTLGL